MNKQSTFSKRATYLREYKARMGKKVRELSVLEPDVAQVELANLKPTTMTDREWEDFIKRKKEQPICVEILRMDLWAEGPKIRRRITPTADVLDALAMRTKGSIKTIHSHSSICIQVTVRLIRNDECELQSRPTYD